MRTFVLFLLFCFILTARNYSQTINPVDWPGMVGYWSFDNATDLTNATVGNDLVLGGTDLAVSGPEAGDGATRIGLDSYYTCTHDIAANGGGSYVNEYTLVVDFKLPQSGQYYCFYQTNTSNSNDGEVFINTTNHVGITETGYSYCILQPNEWYRLVIAVDLGSSFNYYIDGQLIHTGTSQSVDGRYSLDPYFHWFRDNNDEDNEFDIAAAAILDYTMTAGEAAQLGGYGHTFPGEPVAGTDPYLQSLTPTSIYVSWHSNELSSTFVEYGTSAALGQQTSGSYENIGGMNWHTVQLTGLVPDTEYFYKCISGNDSSAINVFSTPYSTGTSGKHLRFLILGDSRTDVYTTKYISEQAEQQLIADYGPDWHREVSFVMHAGDIVSSGYSIDQYINEYFTPYANLSKSVPFMVSIGNHEAESAYYYDYMKYEGFTGSPYEYPSAYNEKFYSFRLGNCLFIAINSNYQYAVSQQTNWLDDLLTNADADTSIDFVFPFCHHPGHSELWPDGNTSYVQGDIIETLKNYYKPVLLTYGHSHNYERGAIELNSTNPDYRSDMVIMLNGGAGSALDRWGMYGNQQDYPEIHYSRDHYIYSIVDVDIDNRSYTGRTFSFGHTDKSLDNQLIDEWYCNLNQAKPSKPIATGVSGIGTSNVTLNASQIEGPDSLMTSQFQLTEIPGDYSSTLADVTKDWQNVYGDSGAPDYIPIDLNAGIDLTSLGLTDIVADNQLYGWRVRYRDFNLKWSDWSDEYIINPVKIEEVEVVENILIASPNPFSSSTEIRFELNNPDKISLLIYDIENRLIATVISNKRFDTGEHKVSWNIEGKDVASGNYFCVLKTEEKTYSKKLIVIK